LSDWVGLDGQKLVKQTLGQLRS